MTEYKKEIEDLLRKLEQEILKSIEEAKEASKPVKLDQQAFGRVSRIDAIQHQQMQLSSLRRMQQRLSMVQSALERIDSESFGCCKVCEEPIAIERLRVKPESEVCIPCTKSKK